MNPVNQKFVLRNEQVRQNAIRFLSQMALDEQKPMQIEVKPWKKNRTAAQNRMLWLWLTIIGESLGYTKEEMHEEFKGRFLLPIMARDSDEVADLLVRVGEEGKAALVKLLSTTMANTAQFTEYLNDIEQAAGALGITLPRPQDLYYEAMGFNQQRGSNQ